MAKVMYCPHCGTTRECTKKGFKKGTGEQMYWCKTCKKTFTSAQSSGYAPKAAEKKSVKPRSKSVSAPPITKTQIYINNSLIKTIDKEISQQEAVKIVSDYFKEGVNVSQVVNLDGTIKYYFTVNVVGVKG